MDRPVPPSEGLTSAAEIARALEVTVQAVSNWMERHPNFPRPAEGDGASRFDVEEVARWLDGRRIHGPVRRDDEEPGDTYGRRYRRALGLPPSTGTADSGAPGYGGGSRRPASTVPGARGGAGRSRRKPVTAGPWGEVMGELKGGDRGTQQDAVTALLWLKASAPDEWRTSAAERHGGVTSRLAQRWPGTAPPLPSALNDRWWQTRLPKAALALDRTSAAAQPQAFAALLDRLAEDRRDHLGWVLTPPGLVQAMVRLADPQPGETVVDPCCGYGELLVAAGRHPARESDQRAVRLQGVVHDERAWRLTLMNAQVNHLTVDVEGRADDLLRSFPGGSLGQWGAAVVLTNPPFTQADWTDDDPAQHGAWPYGPPPRHDAAFAWLQIAVAALTDSGRAVVVAPPHATDPRNARERRILKGMVEDGVVRCVIDLPARLFRETSTPVSVWLLGPPERQVDRGTLLIDARTALSGQGSTQRGLDTAGQDRILAVWNAWLAGQEAEEPGFSTAPSRRQIRDQSYVLSPSRYLRPAPATTSSSPGPTRHAPRSLTDLHLELVRLQEHACHLDAVVGSQITRILRGGQP